MLNRYWERARCGAVESYTFESTLYLQLPSGKVLRALGGNVKCYHNALTVEPYLVR